jgi:hypothetical protein
MVSSPGRWFGARACLRAAVALAVVLLAGAPAAVHAAPRATLSWHGLGELRVGMSRRAFHATGFSLMPSVEGVQHDPSQARFDWSGCVELPLRGAPSTMAMFEDGLLVRIVVTDPAIATRAGVAVGLRDTRVHRAYARTLPSGAQKYDERRRNLRLDSRDGRHAFVFAIEDGAVVEIRAGFADAVDYDSGCPC